MQTNHSTLTTYLLSEKRPITFTTIQIIQEAFNDY